MHQPGVSHPAELVAEAQDLNAACRQRRCAESHTSQRDVFVSGRRLLRPTSLSSTMLRASSSARPRTVIPSNCVPAVVPSKSLSSSSSGMNKPRRRTARSMLSIAWGTRPTAAAAGRLQVGADLRDCANAQLTEAFEPIGARSLSKFRNPAQQLLDRPPHRRCGSCASSLMSSRRP
jgi:hypothetical protein